MHHRLLPFQRKKPKRIRLHVYECVMKKHGRKSRNANVVTIGAIYDAGDGAMLFISGSLLLSDGASRVRMNRKRSSRAVDSRRRADEFIVSIDLDNKDNRHCLIARGLLTGTE